MITYIRGILVAAEQDKIIVDVNGVGYGIFVSNQTMTKLPKLNEEIVIHTYMNVKEDAMQLFGFLDRDDLMVFKLVIGVSGIGPKGGLNILSLLSANDLRFAVISGDVKAIQAAPGIGKKTAEKLIIELKDKLDIEDVFEDGSSFGSTKTVAKSSPNLDKQSEAVQALVALGYEQSQSLKAVRKVEDQDGELTVEDLLKQALKHIMF